MIFEIGKEYENSTYLRIKITDIRRDLVGNPCISFIDNTGHSSTFSEDSEFAKSLAPVESERSCPMKDEKGTASGAANTESGKTSESDLSVSELGEKVKQAKLENPFPTTPEPKEVRAPLDLRTEMFMLNEVQSALKKQYGLESGTKYDILSTIIARCAGVNEE